MKIRTLTLSVISLLAISPLRAAEDKVMLAHTYTKDEKDSYRLEFKMDQGGSSVEMKGEFTLTTLKPNDEGGAEFEMKVTKMEGPENDDNIPVMKSKFDKFGLSPDLEVNNGGVLLVIYSICNYLPKEEVTVGKSFPIDWTAKESQLNVKGDGTVESAKSGDDGKTKLKYNFTVSPHGDAPGKVTSTSTFLTKTGKLLEANGTVVLDNGSATFRVTRITAAK